jgi:Xaa-Pro aminopeptidase
VAVFPESEYEARRARLYECMADAGFDAIFLPPSSDLEYMTGLGRDLPSFGQIAYAHGWVTGAFFSVRSDPVFVLPRMIVAFHLDDDPPPDTIVVAETDDGEERFRAGAARVGPVGRLGIGARTWGETVLALQRLVEPDETVEASSLVNRIRRVKSAAELATMTKACEIAERAMATVAPFVTAGATMADLAGEVDRALLRAGSRCPSFPTHVFAVGERTVDSGDETAGVPLNEGEVVLFDFGAVHDGYCSDFGRTVVVGDPADGLREAYAVLLAAQEAGRVAAQAGALTREVNDACRAPIEAAGFGPYFRHRMGHGIGLDVHERPFLSAEDDTPLETGMTFTDEPSIIVPGRFGVRIEDVIVVERGGGRKLGRDGDDLLVG